MRFILRGNCAALDPETSHQLLLRTRRAFKMVIHTAILLLIVTGIYNTYLAWDKYALDEAVLHSLWGTHVLLAALAFAISLYVFAGAEPPRSHRTLMAVNFVILLLVVAAASTLEVGPRACGCRSSHARFGLGQAMNTYFIHTLIFLISRYLHIVCATILVGGTLFYEMIVPAAIDELRPEQQLLIFARAQVVFQMDRLGLFGDPRDQRRRFQLCALERLQPRSDLSGRPIVAKPFAAGDDGTDPPGAAGMVVGGPCQQRDHRRFHCPEPDHRQSSAQPADSMDAAESDHSTGGDVFRIGGTANAPGGPVAAVAGGRTARNAPAMNPAGSIQSLHFAAESGRAAGAGSEHPSGGLRIQFSRGGGPGGQNVNKLNTKAQAWIQIGQIAGLSPEAIAAPADARRASAHGQR